MLLYRVGRVDNEVGLWYNLDGTYNGTIETLTDKRLAQLPMGYDPMYRDHGKVWQCAAWDFNHLKFWFRLQDMLDLLPKGYRVFEFEAIDFIIDEDKNQVRFTAESIVWKRDITDVFVAALEEIGI